MEKEDLHNVRSLIEKLKNRLSANKFLSAVLTLVTGQALGQCIGLITTPIVSRLYDTAAYGEYAILVSTSTIIATVSQAGLASAIMLPEEDEKAKKVFSTAMYFQILFSLVIIAALFGLKGVVIIFSSEVGYSAMLVAVLIYVLFTNMTNLIRVYMNRLEMYKVLFWNSLICALSTLLITIPAGFFHIGFWGFFAAAIVSNIVCILQMLHRANPFVRVSLKEVKEIFVEFKKFVVFQLPANLIATLSQQLPNQMFSFAYGSAALGGFSMSNKILGIPSKLLASPVSTVYFKTAVEYTQKGNNLALLTYRMVRKIMIFGAPFVLVLIVFGEPLFSFVLGEQWWEAGTISAILALQYLLAFCAMSVGYCRVSIGRQEANLGMSIASLVVVALSLLTGLSMFDSIIGVIGCFAVGSCLVQLIDMTVNFLCMKECAREYLLFSAAYVLIIGGVGLALRYGFWFLMGW